MAKCRIEIDPIRCKGCSLCMLACPKGLIFLNTDELNTKGYHPASITRIEECTGCGNCMLMCPDHAIRVIKEEKVSYER